MGKVFGLRGPHASSVLDRCPTFVSKDKSLKVKLLIGKSRKLSVRGHHFVAHYYYTVTYCNHCQLIIWGIGPQGYQCSSKFFLFLLLTTDEYLKTATYSYNIF